MHNIAKKKVKRFCFLRRIATVAEGNRKLVQHNVTGKTQHSFNVFISISKGRNLGSFVGRGGCVFGKS
jgi:hypothetical protein